MILRHSLTWALAMVLAICGTTSSLAEENGISVSGTGRVMVMPDQLEITVSPGGSAELSSDALVKYRDAVSGVTEAFEGLRMEKLTIHTKELFVQQAGGVVSPQMAALGRGGDPNAKAEVKISRALNLVPCESCQAPSPDWERARKSNPLRIALSVAGSMCFGRTSSAAAATDAME